jgi:hypothetical protein
VVFERGEVSSVVADGVILAQSGQRQARRSTVVDPTMDVTDWLRKQLEQASPELLRELTLERFAPLPAAQDGRIALADWLAGVVIQS